MKVFKDLLLAAERVPDPTPELTAALLAVREFLCSTKSFEYTGLIKIPYTALKLDSIGMDLDDVVKALAGKRTDVQLNAWLGLVLLPEPEAVVTVPETVRPEPEVVTIPNLVA